MNKTHGSRKQDIMMHIKIAIFNHNYARAIDLCKRYNISDKDYNKLVKEVEFIRETDA